MNLTNIPGVNPAAVDQVLGIPLIISQGEVIPAPIVQEVEIKADR